mgnify:CR=1 FL=1
MEETKEENKKSVYNRKVQFGEVEEECFKMSPTGPFVLQRCHRKSDMIKEVSGPEKSEKLLEVPRLGPKPTDVVYVI